MKYRTLSLAIISMISLLSACDANNTVSEISLQSDVSVQSREMTTPTQSLNDGHYFAEEEFFSTTGWKNIVNFEVINGKIENITFDAVNEQATAYKRELSLNGEALLNTDESSELKWHEQIELAETYLINYQEYQDLITEDNLPTIPGISIDLSPFIKLFKTASSLGPLEMGPYQDGQYYAESTDSYNNSKHSINLIVKNGYIIAAHWDTLFTDSSNQTTHTLEDENYAKLWNEQAKLLEQHLLEIQDPMLMSFNEQNKTTDVNGVTIEVHQFIELATKALASGPLLD